MDIMKNICRIREFPYGEKKYDQRLVFTGYCE